jgi:hypothetical protein
MRKDREPHIGEYDTKTNAICDLAHFRLSELGHYSARSGNYWMPVLFYWLWSFST